MSQYKTITVLQRGYLKYSWGIMKFTIPEMYVYSFGLLLSLFCSSRNLSLSKWHSFLACGYFSVSVIVMIHYSQHISDVVRIITIRILLWAIMKQYIAEEIFYNPCLLAIHIILQRATPVSVRDYFPESNLYVLE